MVKWLFRRNATKSGRWISFTTRSSTAGAFASGVGALDATHVYLNDADCFFVVEVPSGFAFVQFTLSYDVEEAYDYVEVNATSSDAVP